MEQNNSFTHYPSNRTIIATLENVQILVESKGIVFSKSENVLTCTCNGSSSNSVYCKQLLIEQCLIVGFDSFNLKETVSLFCERKFSDLTWGANQ
jgi:hypothetical protein